MEQPAALIVDDDRGVRQSLRFCLEADGARVLGVATPEGALQALDRGRFDVVLLDLWLGATSGLTILPEILRRQGRAAVIVITAFAGHETAVQAIQLGAADYLAKPFDPEQLRHTVRRALSRAPVSERRICACDGAGACASCLEAEGLSFESESPKVLALLDTARRAASSNCVILLRGESGTGKNVLAHWLHLQSPRARAPFLSVNCPALTGDLMASTLFGHRRGAFTGALADRAGKVQEAEGGTLFLDEIGELNHDAQARLLRFLNDKSYERLGEAREHRANVRIVAATNRSLEEEVRRGHFREDLSFRLNVITLTLPPLRERREDLLPLARRFLSHFAARDGRTELAFSPSAERAIFAHAWPGNLRELRNAIERAAILAPRDVIEPSDLGLEEAIALAIPCVGDDVSLEALEREHIARVVARAPSLERAARLLGIDSTTLQRKRKRYGLA